MDKSLNYHFQSWRFHRSLAIDLLASLTDGQLSLTVGTGMGTLGQQFRHIAKIELEYLDAIRSKRIDVKPGRLERSIAGSKERLLKALQDNERAIEEELDAIEDPEAYMIDWTAWDAKGMSLIDHIQALADHANLHNGELIVYARTHALPFPESWAPWGL